MMTQTDILLVAVLILLAGNLIRQEAQHKALMRLLSDLGTMLGDWFEAWEKER